MESCFKIESTIYFLREMLTHKQSGIKGKITYIGKYGFTLRFYTNIPMDFNGALVEGDWVETDVERGFSYKFFDKNWTARK